MRKITANFIYPVSSAPVKDTYLLLDDAGIILDLVKYDRSQKEIAGLEYYSGILIPGFINAHCHLELSHLKAKIDEGKGLTQFIKQVQAKREMPVHDIEVQIQKALRYMWSRGINGLGDVVNSSLGMIDKSLSPMQCHNFIELFNENLNTTPEIIQKGVELQDQFASFNQAVSMAAHSIYGTNVELLERICMLQEKGDFTTLHFLESKWESQLETHALINYLNKLIDFKRVLLVHNLHLSHQLFEQIKANVILYSKLYWVLCPNSNQFIKSQLPPVSDFISWGMQLCLGTDSLASNHQLSIFAEMKTLSSAFKDIPFQTLLEMATLNGAKALGMDASLGSFEIGKAPGVLLISNFDFKNQKLNETSEVSRL